MPAHATFPHIRVMTRRVVHALDRYTLDVTNPRAYGARSGKPRA